MSDKHGGYGDLLMLMGLWWLMTAADEEERNQQLELSSQEDGEDCDSDDVEDAELNEDEF